MSVRAVVGLVLALVVGGSAFAQDASQLVRFSVISPLSPLSAVAETPSAAKTDRPVVAGTDSAAGAATAAGADTADDTDYSRWAPPSPVERELLALVPDGQAKKTLYYGSAGLVAGGVVLCALGVSTAFSGFSDGMNAATMHGGLLMFIGGSLLASIFSAVMNAL